MLVPFSRLGSRLGNVVEIPFQLNIRLENVIPLERKVERWLILPFNHSYQNKLEVYNPNESRTSTYSLQSYAYQGYTLQGFSQTSVISWQISPQIERPGHHNFSNDSAILFF